MPRPTRVRRPTKQPRARLLTIIVLYTRAFFATQFANPAWVSPEKRQNTGQLIAQLTQLRGIGNLTPSPRRRFDEDTIRTAPNFGGVYHVYRDDALVYIGGTCRALSSRLHQHLCNSRNPATAPNKRLAELIASVDATVEWYPCQFGGWMEALELVNYRERHGSLPPFNTRIGGLWWCA